MTDLISQLFDIATNEEFSPEQRKELMGIALDEFADGNDVIGNFDGPSLNDLTPYNVSEKQYVRALAKGLEAFVKIGVLPHSVKIDCDATRNFAKVVYVLGTDGTNDWVATAVIEPEPSPSSLNIDAALGKHLTKERLADGTLRLGLAHHLSADE